MKSTTKILTTGLFSVLVLSICSFKGFDIKGWFLAGNDRNSYVIGVEKDPYRNEKVGYIKFTKTKKTKKDGFGTIMQTFIPKDFLGKKVRLVSYIRSKDVNKWAGMWMRVNDRSGKVLSFDNMQNRPIEGTTQWRRYEIILNVPAKSKYLSYGVLLQGTGTVWLDNFRFFIAEDSESTTGSSRAINLTKPTNTSFEESK